MATEQERRELIERGIATATLIEVINTLEKLNRPGVYYYEAESYLKEIDIRQLIVSVAFAYSRLVLGTEDTAKGFETVPEGETKLYGRCVL